VRQVESEEAALVTGETDLRPVVVLKEGEAARNQAAQPVNESPQLALIAIVVVARSARVGTGLAGRRRPIQKAERVAVAVPGCDVEVVQSPIAGEAGLSGVAILDEIEAARNEAAPSAEEEAQ
jgi:hypothetical protein